MTIRLIAAMSKNGIIGINGQIPWKSSADLKRFKELTEGSIVIMGRKTYASLPKALPNRINLVLTRNPSYLANNNLDCKKNTSPPSGGFFFTDSIDRVKRYVEESDKDLWVIGGEEIYREFGKMAQEIDLTEVELDVKMEGEMARFPMELLDGMELISQSRNPKDDRLIHKRFQRL